MRLENWNPNKFDETFENIAINRLVEAAEVVAKKARINLKAQIGKSKTTGIRRPAYEKGDYAGERWTSREPGRLMASIRVVRRRTKSGKALSRKRNVRIYAGHYLAYYAAIVEYFSPFFRPSFWSSMPEIKSIIGAR